MRLERSGKKQSQGLCEIASSRRCGRLSNRIGIGDFGYDFSKAYKPGKVLNVLPY
ncbi:MAG: hypothetical protein QNJ74_22265 [Trichodesmium sp. MO_231.B1]|nr:hypothetical protein [Trichodesmium sp. MO_231.B1]